MDGILNCAKFAGNCYTIDLVGRSNSYVDMDKAVFEELNERII